MKAAEGVGGGIGNRLYTCGTVTGAMMAILVTSQSPAAV
jgi:hypothetical protein